MTGLEPAFPQHCLASISGLFSIWQESLSGKILVVPPCAWIPQGRTHQRLPHHTQTFGFPTPASLLIPVPSAAPESVCLLATWDQAALLGFQPTVWQSGSHPRVESHGDGRRNLKVLHLSGLLSPAACCLHFENSNLPYFSQSSGCLWREGSAASNYSARAESCAWSPVACCRRVDVQACCSALILGSPSTTILGFPMPLL